jgi:tRNA(Ile)-lysidine synthase TilS/MesJ
MRCKLCKKRAIYLPLRFCKEHFLSFYKKRVQKYFESTHARNKKILIAVSGGKDSSALASVLSELKEELGLTLGLFIIDLKIPDYSDQGVKIAKQLSKQFEIPLIVEDLANYPKIIPDFTGKNKKPCSQCGVIKRFLLNKAAIEHDFEYIATGHNLDDEFFFCMHNLLSRNVDQLRRQQKILPPRPEHKLAGRLKPLFYSPRRRTDSTAS